MAEKVNRVVSIRDGKISSERVLKTDYAGKMADIVTLDTSGQAHFTRHEEFAILDRNGRVQIPPEYLQEMGVEGNRVRLSMREGEVIISPPEEKTEEKPEE